MAKKNNSIYLNNRLDITRNTNSANFLKLSRLLILVDRFYDKFAGKITEITEIVCQGSDAYWIKAYSKNKWWQFLILGF